jgi:hypothetical protein
LLHAAAVADAGVEVVLAERGSAGGLPPGLDHREVVLGGEVWIAVGEAQVLVQ